MNDLPDELRHERAFLNLLPHPLGLPLLRQHGDRRKRRRGETHRLGPAVGVWHRRLEVPLQAAERLSRIGPDGLKEEVGAGHANQVQPDVGMSIGVLPEELLVEDVSGVDCQELLSVAEHVELGRAAALAEVVDCALALAGDLGRLVEVAVEAHQTTVSLERDEVANGVEEVIVLDGHPLDVVGVEVQQPLELLRVAPRQAS